MADFTIRNVVDDDRGFVRSMLYEAAFWRSEVTTRPALDEALQSPDLRVYLNGWGRTGDRGLIATAGAAQLGAAWYRLFSQTEHGYGFVDPQTPELTIAVADRYRGIGVGRSLLAALLVQAHLDGHAALSLSVEDSNRAVALYQRLGFVTIEHGRMSQTMVARLESR